MTRSGVLRTAALVLAAVALHLVLIQPNHPGAMTWGALRLFPLELPAILLGLAAAAPGPATAVARAALVTVLTLGAVLKGADYALFTAFGRGFNPVADLPLAGAGVHLAAGSVGWPAAAAGVGAALLAVAVLAVILWWATGVWTRLRLPPLARPMAATAAVLAAGIAVAEVGYVMKRWQLPVNPPGAAFTARVLAERVILARATMADLRAFAAAAAEDPFRDATGLLDTIDRDVLVIFVESYGRTSIDTPFYAGMHGETLRRAEARLAGLGLAMRSGYLTSPTRGGQSWLAHATFANGLWIDGQRRHGAVLASRRETLFHIAARSGFRTAAVMPQITMDWPEAAFMGFDTVLPAAGLGYRGRPFNWVTMPDQFTLAALDRLVRDPPGPPVFAQVALASSHAPWTPVPDIVAWDAVGDGTVFDAMAAAGEPPDVVWRDRERVRAQYRLAVDYALRTVLDYAARHAADPPLLIVLGDHQAAPFVALDERREVPIHVIGPPALVARVAAWGWAEGLVPAPGTATLPMERMRDLIVGTFSRAPRRSGSS